MLKVLITQGGIMGIESALLERAPGVMGPSGAEIMDFVMAAANVQRQEAYVGTPAIHAEEAPTAVDGLLDALSTGPFAGAAQDAAAAKKEDPGFQSEL
jgi:hypothetical protein